MIKTWKPGNIDHVNQKVLKYSEDRLFQINASEKLRILEDPPQFTHSKL